MFEGFPRSGDGVSEDVFHMLWQQPRGAASLSKTLGHREGPPIVRIPQTVIYRYCQPSCWYFMSQDRSIKRKSKGKLTAQKIEEEFLKRVSPSGIVATYIYNKPNDTGGVETVAEFLDAHSLHEFLFVRLKKANGILQKWIDPKEESNNVIHASWAPKMCLLTRCTNKKKLCETRCDVYERASTFEGPEFYCTRQPIKGQVLPRKVNQVADAVVTHFAAVSHDKMKVSRMAMYFKVDSKDRLWLLYTSSLRLEDEFQKASAFESVPPAIPGYNNTPLEVNMRMKLPDFVRFATTNSVSAPAQLQCKTTCPVCHKKVNRLHLHGVQYKFLIAMDDKIHREHGNPSVFMYGKTKQSTAIPPTIAKLHPRLTLADYNRFRDDPLFLLRMTKCCEECYLLSTNSSGHCGPNGNIDTRLPFGTQALDPMKLRSAKKRLAKAKAVSELRRNQSAPAVGVNAVGMTSSQTLEKASDEVQGLSSFAMRLLRALAPDAAKVVTETADPFETRSRAKTQSGGSSTPMINLNKDFCTPAQAAANVLSGAQADATSTSANKPDSVTLDKLRENIGNVRSQMAEDGLLHDTKLLTAEHVGNAYRIEFKNQKKNLAQRDKRVRKVYGHIEKAAAARDARFDVGQKMI